MPWSPQQLFLEARPTDVVVAGRPAGQAVSLGRAQVFYTARPELLGLDGRRFAGLSEIEQEVRRLWLHADLRDRLLVFKTDAAERGSSKRLAPHRPEPPRPGPRAARAALAEVRAAGRRLEPVPSAPHAPLPLARGGRAGSGTA